MKNIINRIKNDKLLFFLSILIIGLFLVLIIRITYSYLAASINEAKGNVTLSSDTTDKFEFIKGEDLSLNVTSTTLPEGGGNYAKSTTYSASLLANSTTNEAEETYFVYFNIPSNTINYIEENTPEVILTISQGDNEITNINGLTYGTYNGVSGFDITNKSGSFNIVSDYLITSNSSENATIQDWTFTLTYLNQGYDQSANYGNSMNVEILMSKNDYKPVINGVEASEITTSSITLAVDAKTSVEENTIAKYYYQINDEEYIESTSNTYTFNTLTYGTTYNFNVYVVDNKGFISNTYTYTSKTSDYVNPVVNSVSVTDTSTSSISVSVSASGGTNNVATYYYSINNGAYTSSSNNTHTFSGLSKGTTYTIKVYVKDTNGVDSAVNTISAETDNGPLLADYIKELYTSQGSNGLYYHTSSLANSAEDNSYRYAGADPNNYVCFGSDASTCPSDNLYRIIGVFGSEVKLIKNTSIGNYYWSGSSSNTSNTWSSSTLNTGTLNGTYLSGLSSTWQNKIATHSWKVGGMAYSQTNTAKQYYDVEVGSSSSSTTYSAKIGLMYVSDYGFAASPSYWTTELYNYEPSKSSNWMNVNINEWTISRTSDDSNYAFGVYSSGFVASSIVYYTQNAVRPVFYLTSSTRYVSGSGSSADPIRIN